MAEGIVLRVTPEELKNRASEISGLIQELQQSFSEIEQISSKTRNYWIGEAGDQDRSGYQSLKDEKDRLLIRLADHPKNLLTMAGIYEETESGISTENSQLETDEIV